MTASIRTVLLALMLAASAALAQTGGTPVEPVPVPLVLEKQAIVKEYAQREQMPEAQTSAPVTVGMQVPEEIELWSLPQDVGAEVPNVTSYKFFRTGTSIAVVDPESRKVIQLIPIQ